MVNNADVGKMQIILRKFAEATFILSKQSSIFVLGRAGS